MDVGARGTRLGSDRHDLLVTVCETQISGDQAQNKVQKQRLGARERDRPAAGATEPARLLPEAGKWPFIWKGPSPSDIWAGGGKGSFKIS